jgi:hypothetical protein
MFVRTCLLCWWPNWIRSFVKTRLLWLPLSVIFSHIGDACCYSASLSSPSDNTHFLSSEAHSHSDNTRSLSSEGHSLSILRSPRRLAPFAANSYAHWGSHSLSSKSQRCNKPTSHMRDSERGQHRPRHHPKQTPASPPPRARCRPPCCHRGRDVASDPPPRSRSLRRKSSSRRKLPPFTEIIQLS